MICPKCGNEYNDNLRCCFKCGALNPKNEENMKNNATKSMLDVQKKELDKNSNHFYNIRNINFFNNKPLYIVINVVIFIILFFILKKINICNNNLLIFTYCLITTWYLICISFIFNKANHTWWWSYIPIYNLGILFKIIYGNIKLLFLTIILLFLPRITILMFEYLDLNISILNSILPIIHIISNVLLIIIYIITMFKLSKKFNSNSILTILFSFIMIPLIAFNKEYKYMV